MDWLLSIDLDLDHEPTTRLLRGLKGGGGGDGGGGGGGSSYSGGGGDYGYSNGASDGRLPKWGAILLLVLIFVVPVLGLVCYCVYHCKKDQSSANIGSDNGFDEAVSKARGKQTKTISNAYKTNASTPTFDTYTGDFDVKYKDRGKVLSGVTKIQLKNNTSCYKIKGECSDADGSATITEGFVTYSGDAWWIEETFSGSDSGLKVLTEGKFDFTSNTLTGTWRANTGVRGSYTSFNGKNVSKTFSPLKAMTSHPQTLDDTFEEDIPVVVASVVTPAVASVPVAMAEPETSLNAPTALSFPTASVPPTY